MTPENENMNLWDKASDFFHDGENKVIPPPESEEFKFTKKLSNLNKEASIVSQFSNTKTAWLSVIEKMPRTLKPVSFVKYAAIIAISFLIGTLFTNIELLQTGTDQFAKVEVPYGQTSKLTLQDGTEVWLNSGTSLKYPTQFSGKREVFLEGEAFFKVAKDKKRPFLVDTKKLQVKVLGTSFNLSAYEEDESNSLTLIEGKVELNKANGKFLTEISPGEMALIEEKVIRIKEVETSYYSSWIDGKLAFFDVPLAEIAKKLERSYNVKIHFENKQLENIRFTGTFLKYKPIEQILQAIKIIVPIDYEMKISQDNKNEIRIFDKK